MKKLLLFITITLLILTGFSIKKPMEVIYIQPLGKVTPVYIEQIKKSVKSFYGYNCIVKNKIEVTPDILSKVTKRVEANKLLKKYNSQKADPYAFL
jgi:hypothetical protein